jgi:formate-dependent nitrite reductase membrane component NrfD
MNEFTNTRHNHLIDPVMHVWHWEIPLYLFLGGVVAGIMILTGVRMLRKDSEAPSLAITECEEDALGSLNCARMVSVVNNRNLQSNAFGEGMIQIGLLF